jgi:TetR/AcrR family transcriptional regulator, transcriptional repressor for nem operon
MASEQEVIDREPGVKDTRRRLIETAAQLFWQQGYHATGLSQIYAQAHVRSGSFYYFFPSKEAVLRAVLDHYQSSFFETVVAPRCAHEPDPIERVFCLLNEYRMWILNTGFRFGCPVGRLAMEMDPQLVEVFHGIESNFRMWADTVEGWLDETAAGLPESPSRQKIATFVLTVMEGSVMQARAARSIQPFDDSVEMLRNYFQLLTAGRSRAEHNPSKRRSES